MCGRYQLSSQPKDVQLHFNVGSPVVFKQSYNITPSSYCPIVRLNNEKNEVALCYWGLIPSWAKDKKITPINAKAETIREKPFFRMAYRHHRCIIPANGFYEWQGTKGHKQAFYFYPEGSDFFGFAGLWEIWERPDGVIESFTIITTEANSIMAPIHERMPVILNHQDYAEWLHDGEYSLLKPFDAEGMGCHAISTKVNNPTHDGPELIRKAS
jgi:putative SOS response-associated peptidase YedK